MSRLLVWRQWSANILYILSKKLNTYSLLFVFYLLQNKWFLFDSLYDYSLYERCARCFRTPVPDPKLMLNLCYKEAKGSLWLKCFVVVLVVADHFTQMLHCEHECVRDLATRPGRLSPMENYLPLHYDYLQFAYYQGEWFTMQGKKLKRSQKLHVCQSIWCNYEQKRWAWCAHTERDADYHPINRLAHPVWIYPLSHN